jgi:hypothetical protein
MITPHKLRSDPPTDLYSGTREIVLHPIRTLVPPWSWKAAVLSAMLRAASFFVSNLRSGPKQALRAMIVEAVFAIFTAGVIGAISQRLRAANPAWATAALVCIGLPGVMVCAQFLLHRAARTPHVGLGLVSSFSLSAIAAAFTWYAMRHGTLLGGTSSTSLRHDFHNLPAIMLAFLLAVPRKVSGFLRG